MNKVKSIVNILLFLCLSLLSCGKKDSYKTIVVLFDLTESTNRKQFIQNYLDGFKIVLSKVNHGDVIACLSILESSFSEPTIPINEKIPPFIPSSDNPLIVKKEREEADKRLDKKKEEIYTKAERLVSRVDLGRKVLRTDILSSLHIAAVIFKNHYNEKNILVIFSDMIQESSEYNFRTEDLSERRIEEIISKERRMNRIPDLKGVKVYVAGATAPTNEQFFNIRNFWMKYFKECGAILLEENYGPTLINFER